MKYKGTRLLNLRLVNFHNFIFSVLHFIMLLSFFFFCQIIFLMQNELKGLILWICFASCFRIKLSFYIIYFVLELFFFFLNNYKFSWIHWGCCLVACSFSSFLLRFNFLLFYCYYNDYKLLLFLLGFSAKKIYDSRIWIKPLRIIYWK